MTDPAWKPIQADASVKPEKQCPFCGSLAIGFYEYVYVKDFAAACTVCGAQGPRRSSQQEARKLWDARATD